MRALFDSANGLIEKIPGRKASLIFLKPRSCFNVFYMFGVFTCVSLHSLCKSVISTHDENITQSIACASVQSAAGQIKGSWMHIASSLDKAISVGSTLPQHTEFILASQPCWRSIVLGWFRIYPEPAAAVQSPNQIVRTSSTWRRMHRNKNETKCDCQSRTPRWMYVESVPLRGYAVPQRH
jgi:hypothetical protein